MKDVTFWLSLVLIAGCLLLCLQKEKRVVSFIREAGRWAWHVPIISAGLAVLVIVLFGFAISLENAVIAYGTVIANLTVIFFLHRLSG